MEMQVSRTELARKTREVLDQVQKGGLVVIESYGEAQVVLLDFLDYQILRAAAGTHATQQHDDDGQSGALARTIVRYLAGDINIGKAAEELAMSRFELMERFERLGIPLRFGAESIDELRSDVNAIQRTVDK